MRRRQLLPGRRWRYLYNAEEEPRQWGAQGDWKRLSLELNWDVGGSMATVVDENAGTIDMCVY